MEYFLSLLVIFALVLISKWTYQLDKHYEWFNSLKPGDNILVTIFGNDCECQKEAMVIAEPIGKYVETQMSTDEKLKCSSCHKANDSCFYQATLFHRNTVSKLPE